MRHMVGKTILLLALSLLLVGCADFVDQDQINIAAESNVVVDADHSAGQTFVARHAGLQGIDVWLDFAACDEGEIRLHLRQNVQAPDDLATAAVTCEAVNSPRFYRFAFTPLDDSRDQYYYLFLEVLGKEEVQVSTGAGDVYLDGAFYRDHQPVDAQLAFRLSYDYPHIFLDLLSFMLGSVGTLLLGVLVYVVPGWGFLILLQLRNGQPIIRHWGEGLGVSVGLSLTVYPVLLLLIYAFRVRLGVLNAWLPIVGGVGILVWHYKLWRWGELRAAIVRWMHSESLMMDLALIVVVFVAGSVRLFAVRGLEMPLWDDSVQHTVIVQRILESGGLFQSWLPYTPYVTFSNQFGFHVNVAAWSWFTGQDTTHAIIQAGQLINWLAVLALFPLAYRIQGSWGGLFVILIAGLWKEFPAYYSNWGRYPQMAGQAILPVAAWWLWVTFHERRERVPWILAGAFLVLGTVLTYYRMSFHYVAFVVAALLVLAKTAREKLFQWRTWVVLLATAVVVIVVAWPWLSILSRHLVVPALTGTMEGTKAVSLWERIESLTFTWSFPEAGVVFLGTLLALWGGGSMTLPVVWLWMLIFLPILRLVPLPGVHIIQDFTIQTSLYIPQSLILGTTLGWGAFELTKRRWAFRVVIALLTIGAGLAGAIPQATIMNRDLDLSTYPDLRAAAWLDKNLPSDAIILINGIRYPDGVSAVGGDAGWWLPILTGREVTIPPQYALLAEQPLEKGYSEAVNALVFRLFDVSPVSPEGIAAICNFPHPINYVYLGQRQGMVDAMISPTPHPMLPPRLLLQHPAFHLIYHQDRVMIFRFDRLVCSQVED